LVVSEFVALIVDAATVRTKKISNFMVFFAEQGCSTSGVQRHEGIGDSMG